MNKTFLIGRLTKEIETKQTANSKVASFTLAVDRMLSQEQRDNGAQSADFINCVAWNNSADILERYTQKGSKIAIEGRIQTRSYDNQQGQKVYVTEVKVDRVELLEKLEKKEPEQTPNPFYREPVSQQTLTGNSRDLTGYSTEIQPDDLPFY